MRVSCYFLFLFFIHSTCIRNRKDNNIDSLNCCCALAFVLFQYTLNRNRNRNRNRKKKANVDILITFYIIMLRLFRKKLVYNIYQNKPKKKMFFLEWGGVGKRDQIKDPI